MILASGKATGIVSSGQGAAHAGRNVASVGGLLKSQVLQPYQQLQLAAIKAQKTATLTDDLQIAQEIQSIFDQRVKTTKFTGKKLFDLEQQDAQAQLAVTNIEQQIASNAAQQAAIRTRNAE